MRGTQYVGSVSYTHLDVYKRQEFYTLTAVEILDSEPRSYANT